MPIKFHCDIATSLIIHDVDKFLPNRPINIKISTQANFGVEILNILTNTRFMVQTKFKSNGPNKSIGIMVPYCYPAISLHNPLLLVLRVVLLLHILTYLKIKQKIGSSG